LLGGLRQLTDSFAGGFLAFGLAAFACAGALLYVSLSWENNFVGRGGLSATAKTEAFAEPVMANLIGARSVSDG
jgi:hypothetical protein